MTAVALSDRDLLARLVAFDTTSAKSNLELVDFLSDYLDLPGVRVHRHPAPAEPKATLVVEVGPATDARRRDGLVLSGHTDVVPAGEGWSSDPFTLVERDGELYARGSADMKGFLALAVNLAREAAERPLTEPLVLVLTYDEEVGTLGARHFHDTWPASHPLPRQAVIGEPTELRPIRVHKGHVRARFTFYGVSAHSAYPHLGRNAIEPAGRLVVALSELRRALEQERMPSSSHYPEVPAPSLNVGVIRGGVASNVVPERCTVEVGVRLLPGMAAEPVVARLRDTAAAACGADAPEWELLSISPPMELPASSPLLALASAAAGPPTEAAAYATDAGWFQSMGMDCLLLGPGTIRVAHKPDEHLPAADLVAGRAILERLVAGCCLAPREGAG
jgi:acetylornithine deacetylase